MSLKINTKKYSSAAYRAQIDQFLRAWESSDTHFALHTSGSTGRPQRIALAKEHMRASARATLKYLDIPAGGSALLCLPLDKIAGVMMLLRALEGQLSLSPVDPSNNVLKQLAREEHWDFAALVPQQAAAMPQALEQIEVNILGGGPLSPTLIQELSGLKSRVYHSYGMTETISHVALRQIAPQMQPHFEALPGVELSLDQRGCLALQAPYLGIEAPLQTNDLVELITAREFRWRGRWDNVVLSGGLKLYPEEIEAQIELRQNFFLAAAPHPELGQALIGIVEGPLPGKNQLERALTALRKYQKPRNWYSLEKFARTSNGKLQRQKSLELLNLAD